MPPKGNKEKRQRAPMSAAHKAALAEGRDQGRMVRRYLEALEVNRPRRGRKVTPESMKKKLASITQKLPGADPLTRLQLTQERMNLEKALSAGDQQVDLTQLEREFVKAARPYGARKGISYAAWRAAGVDAEVLRKAGITRGA